VAGVDVSKISLMRITGGITNRIFKIDYGGAHPALLVRLFGAEGMIDRDLEVTTLTHTWT
jgi:hypothetical protein